MRFFLFGTAGCHLCEQAEQIINECLSDAPAGLVVDTIDIAEQDAWHDQYALRIPVLFCPETRQELAWPFDQSLAAEFILISTQTLQENPELNA